MLHLFYVPSTMPNGKEFQTTFHLDFDIAEHYGINAVKDTFRRAFDSWMNDIKFMTELCIVMNNRCWFWHDQGNIELSELYADYYYQVKDYVYSDDSEFSEEDQSYFFEMTD